ncbi:MAG: hypothetical protein HC853_03460 [Anaerolineae bacterium]|nr:hypothetical protein [Anaerolineae bacterium]
MLAPLLAGEADVAIGDRQLAHAAYCTWGKRVLEWVGSWVVRKLSSVPVRDAVCGFRAYTRTVTQQLRVTNSFSHTLETLVQMDAMKLRVVNVVVTSQVALRTSRLSRNALYFVQRQAAILLRTWAAQHVSALHTVSLIRSPIANEQKMNNG